MANRCELTDVGVQAGNNVSHSKRRTRRRFLPNVQNVTVRSDALNRELRLKIAAKTLRSIDHNGGLDNFLVTAKARNLSEAGQKLRRQVKKALAATESAA